MRLATVKLAGFKSFVDPTTFHAPTNLTGIVGPNGCRKSNLLDAVRWVMGEVSAKVLRGESMADVIFSGSSTRKPVGTATVELIFDNSDGRVGGQIAHLRAVGEREGDLVQRPPLGVGGVGVLDAVAAAQRFHPEIGVQALAREPGVDAVGVLVVERLVLMPGQV